MAKFQILDYAVSSEPDRLIVDFKYRFDHVGGEFVERVEFPADQGRGQRVEGRVDDSLRSALDSLPLGSDLKLALDHYALMAGVSYFKFFPDAEIEVASENIELFEDQREYLNTAYLNGLGEYWFVNGIDPGVFRGFTGEYKERSTKNEVEQPLPTSLYPLAPRALVLQSGGKDSILTAELVRENGIEFDSIYVTNASKGYPKFLDESAEPGKLLLGQRVYDGRQTDLMLASGGHLGHVPFSAIYAAYSIVVAVLGGYTHVLASLESSSNEGNEKIGDFVVNHQWSKSLQHEVMVQSLFAKMYQGRHNYGSIIRPFTELKIAELFAEKCFSQFGFKFSSCNQANYLQGHDPSSLGWCLKCAKCANAALLFAPFLSREKLEKLFSGNPFKSQALFPFYVDLLGQGEHKPFECVAEVDELKLAYQMAVLREPDYTIEGLDFVDLPIYDYQADRDHSDIVEELGF